MSVKEHLYLLLLIFKQEKLFSRAREGNLGSRRIFLIVLAGKKKKLLTSRMWPAGHYLPTPDLHYHNNMEVFCSTSTDVCLVLQQMQTKVSVSFSGNRTGSKSEYKYSQQIVSKYEKIGMGTTAMCKGNLKEEFR
jgi:hypothetical protein